MSVGKFRSYNYNGLITDIILSYFDLQLWCPPIQGCGELVSFEKIIEYFTHPPTGNTNNPRKAFAAIYFVTTLRSYN